MTIKRAVSVFFWLWLLMLRACAEDAAQTNVATANGYLGKLPERMRLHNRTTGDKSFKWLALASGAVVAADIAQTCYGLANGKHEVGLPTQSCAGASGLLSVQFVSVVALAKFVPAPKWLKRMAVVAPGVVSGMAIRRSYSGERWGR
jgi:hypothetical protein